jgi:hypothetical protein
MQLLERLNVPRRLTSRLWLLTLPSAVLSFERRQKVPPLPIGRGRFAGLALAAAGVAAIIAARRLNRSPQLPRRGLPRFQQKPAVGGGLLALTGAALLLRSTALAAYALALAFAFALETIDLDEPHLPGREPAQDSAWDYTETLV